MGRWRLSFLRNASQKYYLPVPSLSQDVVEQDRFADNKEAIRYFPEGLQNDRFIHTAQMQIPLGKGNFDLRLPETPVDLLVKLAPYLRICRSASMTRTRSSKSSELSPKLRNSTWGRGRPPSGGVLAQASRSPSPGERRSHRPRPPESQLICRLVSVQLVTWLEIRSALGMIRSARSMV